jgi:flagellar export protein FliJ
VAARRKDKLRALTRLLEHRENLAQQRLVERRRALEAAQSKAQNLLAMQNEYHQRLAEVGRGGLASTDLRLWRRFTASLSEVVEVQSDQQERLHRELEAAQQACAASRARRKGGELLVEAERRAQASRERRVERTESSDRAARRSATSHRQHRDGGER